MILTRPSSWEDATFLRSNFTPGGKKCRSPPHFESFQPHYFSRTINFSLLISLSLSFRREGGIPNHWKNVAKIRVIDVLHLERPGWVTHVWREKWNWRTFISVCFTLLLSGNSLAFIIKWAHCRWKFLFVYYLCIYLCVCVCVSVCVRCCHMCKIAFKCGECAFHFAPHQLTPLRNSQLSFYFWLSSQLIGRTRPMITNIYMNILREGEDSECGRSQTKPSKKLGNKDSQIREERKTKSVF